MMPIGGESGHLDEQHEESPNQIGSTIWQASHRNTAGTVTTIMPRLSTRQPTHRVKAQTRTEKRQRDSFKPTRNCVILLADAGIEIA